MSEYSKWYPANVLPVRDGVYQVKKLNGVIFRKFENGRWFYGDMIEGYAAREIDTIPRTMYRPWRGLAEEPK